MFCCSGPVTIGVTSSTETGPVYPVYRRHTLAIGDFGRIPESPL
jgi:hypothetical protein